MGEIPAPAKCITERNMIETHIQSFLERTTEEQWETFINRRPDDGTTILVAELILQIIATLSSSVATTIKSSSKTSEESFLSKLHQTLSKAIGIHEEADSKEVITLTNIIQEEVKENLNCRKKSSTIQRFIPFATISTMIVHFMEILKTFSHKIKAFLGPRPRRVDVEQVSGAGDGALLKNLNSPIAEGMRTEMDFEFRQIFSPLMVDLPKDQCEELQREVADRIEIAAVKISYSPQMRKKPLDIKRAEIRIKAFFNKCLAKICLLRIFAKLKEEHPQTASTSINTAQKIIDELTNPICILPVFFQTLSHLIYNRIVIEAPFTFVQSDADRKVMADIKRKSWVLTSLLNWYLNSQVKWVANRVTAPFVEQAKKKMLAEKVESKEDIVDQEAQRDKNRAYVKYLTEKIVNTVCSDLNVVPAKINGLINNLKERVWHKVKDLEFYTDSEILNNLEKTMKKLYKVLGGPDKVLFLIMSEDQVVFDQIMLIITKRLLTPRKKSMILKFFCSLGHAICKPFKQLCVV